MSEYQYYEFHAVDKPLTDGQVGELRAISTRATITPTSFVNTYNWGDLQADPRRLVEKYFDAFLYVANWGSHWFTLRLPRRLCDEKAAEPFCGDEGFSVRSAGEHTILSFSSEDEDGDWDSGEGWLASLIPLRADLLAGDFRCLYLGWLLRAQDGALDPEDVEPALPPGCPSLRELSAPLEALAGFLRIDGDLLEVAIEGLPTGGPPPSQDSLAGWLRDLPVAEKDAFLLRVTEGEGPTVRCELLKRFREEYAREATTAATDAARRTVGHLLECRDARAAERGRREAEERDRQAALRAGAAAAAHTGHLNSLVGGEAELWDQVEALIRTRQPKGYDQAVGVLRDLHDLASRQGSTEDFQTRLARLRERHHRKASLQKRLDCAGL